MRLSLSKHGCPSGPSNNKFNPDKIAAWTRWGGKRWIITSYTTHHLQKFLKRTVVYDVIALTLTPQVSTDWTMKRSSMKIIPRSNSQKYSNTNSAMQWSHHHYKDSPEIDRIGSSPPPWNMHSNKTSLTQYIALVAAYATTEQHHQSPWCRCSDVARHLFCRWQLCVENRHPLEVHQLLFLTWNICQRVLRFTYYTMYILGDAAVEMAQRNKTQWRRPDKQKSFLQRSWCKAKWVSPKRIQEA